RTAPLSMIERSVVLVFEALLPLDGPATRSWYNPLMRHLRVLVPLFLCWPASPAPGSEPQHIDFGRDVRPILERSCWQCHGPDKQKGGLRFDRRQGAVVTGDSGKMAILPGRAEIRGQYEDRELEGAAAAYPQDPETSVPEGTDPTVLAAVDQLKPLLSLLSE